MTDNTDRDFMGECSVCYTGLSSKTGHIITECIHLFCVKCLLKWHNQSSTCPICRQNLYESDNDDFYEHDDYTDDSGDDGRFDTIDDYLVDEVNWSGIVEEDDRQLVSSGNYIQDVSEMRVNNINFTRYNTYISHMVSEKEFYGEISQTFIPRNEYLANIQFGNQYYYEIVVKSEPNDTHIFGHIIEKQVYNVQRGFYPDTDIIRNRLERGFQVYEIDPLNDVNEQFNESEIYKQIKVIMFSDIRRMYRVNPIIS
jgi:hypothetical protein